jgi:hypothetical protein
VNGILLAANEPGAKIENLKIPALRRSQTDLHQERHTHWIIARGARKIRVVSREVDRHPLPCCLNPRNVMQLSPAVDTNRLSEIE